MKTKSKFLFKAGDEVPQWIEHTERCKAVFGVDVVAYIREGPLLKESEELQTYVEIFPVAVLREGQSIMRVNLLDPLHPEGMVIVGAPTFYHDAPEDAQDKGPSPSFKEGKIE